MGLVLWIDQNTFASDLLQKVFKQKNLSFYTLTSVDDFLYLVEDLKPQIIVLDTVTYQSNKEAFTQQYKASTVLQQTPTVLLDNDGSLDFIENQIGSLKRPFDPFKIPEQLKQMLEPN